MLCKTFSRFSGTSNSAYISTSPKDFSLSKKLPKVAFKANENILVSKGKIGAKFDLALNTNPVLVILPYIPDYTPNIVMVLSKKKLKLLVSYGLNENLTVGP